jgi:putative acetyltransferase
MKIRPLTLESHPKVAALLQQAFSPGRYEVQLFEKLHEKDRTLHEWVCIHRNTVTAYIAFSNAYDGHKVCGLHLAPLAVQPRMQGQGIGSELLRFALRQKGIKNATIFVLGAPRFFGKFGFSPCSTLRNDASRLYTVGYEPEFKTQKST